MMIYPAKSEQRVKQQYRVLVGSDGGVCASFAGKLQTQFYIRAESGKWTPRHDGGGGGVFLALSAIL